MTKFTKVMKLGKPTDHAPFCIDGICNEDGEIFEVCSVWGVDEEDSLCEQSAANAHLLAAAPEMYAMLVDISKSNCRCDEFVEDIQSLLLKIKGE